MRLNLRAVLGIDFNTVRTSDEPLRMLLAEYAEFRVRQADERGAQYRWTPPSTGDFDGERGTYVIASVEGETAGCAGIRWLDTTTWEVKNVWVRPEVRSRGVAKALIAKVAEFAAEHGAERLRLDTHESLAGAVRLYQSLGFAPIAAYNSNPNASMWFELALSDAGATPPGSGSSV